MTTKQGTFNSQDLKDILNGAVLLGSGGGGARTNGEQLLAEILKITDAVAYVTHDQIEPGKKGAVLAAMGAPAEATKSELTVAPRRSFELLEKVTGDRFSYVVPVETGSVAHMASLLVAAQKGLAVVDGDGGGRAFPSLAMATFAANGVSSIPATLVTEKAIEQRGTEIVLTNKDPAMLDDISRAVLSSPEFKDVGAMTTFAMSGATVQKTIVPNTLTRARDLGAFLRMHPNDPAAVIEHLGGVRLAAGPVTRITKTTTDAFDFGTVVVGDDFFLLNQNENLLAWSESESSPVAMAPDSICYLGKNGMTYSNADLKIGLHVTVIGLPASSNIKTKYFLNVFRKTLQEDFSYYGPFKLLPDRRQH